MPPEVTPANRHLSLGSAFLREEKTEILSFSTHMVRFSGGFLFKTP